MFVKKNEKQKILTLIPARMASSRPGKPLRKINGKTMIQIVLENAKKSKLSDFIAVATLTKLSPIT